MLHKPAASSGPDHAIDYKKRLGMYMFILYSLVYAGFVVVNLASPVSMEKIIFGGLNLAVVYGFGLIVFALVLALIYSWMCAKEESRLNVSSNKEGE
ncbi:hypothetical protein BVX98_04905 [bacterium F11]|nr:hypothetical protein BVX98_04905 [bacterium F11]